ncbi:MAG: hypothetical protein HXY30_04165 [Pseudorhodoplanes sp.]|nr:hypothetical protein [Pseudorhodoplanes sp.]
MTAITYGTNSVATAPAAAPKTKGFFARAYDAFVEAQMRRAMREIKLYQHLLPADLEIAGGKISYKNEDQLPFTR